MASIKKPHLVEVLEKDFHLVHNKIVKAKDNYLANHEKEYKQAKRAVEATRKKLAAAKKTGCPVSQGGAEIQLQSRS